MSLLDNKDAFLLYCIDLVHAKLEDDNSFLLKRCYPDEFYQEVEFLLNEKFNFPEKDVYNYLLKIGKKEPKNVYEYVPRRKYLKEILKRLENMGIKYSGSQDPYGMKRMSKELETLK